MRRAVVSTLIISGGHDCALRAFHRPHQASIPLRDGGAVQLQAASRFGSVPSGALGALQHPR